jgi:hypothetical protein
MAALPHARNSANAGRKAKPFGPRAENAGRQAGSVRNLGAAVSLYFMYYNFVRIHQTLRTTPAMAAGVTEKLWDVEDIVALLDSN